MLAKHRQPTGAGGLVDNTDLAGALGHRPANDEIRHQLNGHIVHHQGEQGLVGIILRLKKCGDQRPNGTGQHTGYNHRQYQQRIGDLATQADHTRRRCQTADQHLTLAADVPKPHFERRGQRQGHAQQHSQTLQQVPYPAGGAKGTTKHGGIHLERIFMGQKHSQCRTCHQRQYNGTDANGPGQIPGQCRPLGNVKERLFGLVLMHGFRPPPSHAWSSGYPAPPWWRTDRPQCR